MRLIRYGRPVDVQVEVAERADEHTMSNVTFRAWPGLSLVSITDDIRRQLPLEKIEGKIIVGAVVKGSPADMAGVETGDIIVGVNERKVASLLEFYRTLNAGLASQVVLEINRQGTRKKLTMKKTGRQG